MADERTKKVVTSIVLIAIFLVVSIYIGLVIMRVYLQSSSTSSEQSKNSVSCVGYSYSINDIAYENGLLSFNIKNSEISDYEEMTLIIKSGTETKEIALSNLIRGLNKKVEGIQINIESGKFSSYPKSCGQDTQSHTI